jgi:hypothetical protein
MRIDPDEVLADGIQVRCVFVGDSPVINNHFLDEGFQALLLLPWHEERPTMLGLAV